MKKRLVFLISIIPLIVTLSLRSEEKISKEYKDWLETVSPIITKTEKEVFLKLKTPEERNKFIEMFWRQRDPLPDTNENEFYQEYMKRVQFADANFGRETSKKGSQTERGYFYLLLGPPLERQIFATQSNIYPLELWNYRGEQKFGLPPYFYLIFYQPQGLGEYRLYRPGVEGPEKLVIPSLSGQSFNRNTAYNTIRDFSGELANASLSYLPGEKTFGKASFSSDTIVSSVHALPEKKFSDTYARSYLDYKDYVETDYTHNFIESNFTLKVFKNFNQFFVHWAVEPKKINFAFFNDKYHAVFQLILRMEDLQGNPVLEKEEEIPVKVTPEQYREHERQLFSFQGVLPVIPGNYKIFFLLKNKTSRDFTSFQKSIFIPQEKEDPFLCSPLLYHSQNTSQKIQQRKLRAFSFNEKHYLINSENNFHPQEKMGIYCQVYNIKEKADKEFSLEIFSLDADKPIHRFRKSLEEILTSDGIGVEVGPLSLSSFKPGYYKVQVSILDKKGGVLLTERENFILLSRPYPVIPWSYSKVYSPYPNPEHLHLKALQHFMARNYEHARIILEQALKMKDDSRTRLLLGKTLYALGQFKDSIAVVLPFFQKTQDNEAAKIIAVNYTGLKDWSASLVYLEKLLEHALELSVLNLAAECYINLNQPEKALPLLKKSLELYPNQQQILDWEKEVRKQLENKKNVSMDQIES